jgi:hypothetical protein
MIFGGPVRSHSQHGPRDAPGDAQIFSLLSTTQAQHSGWPKLSEDQSAIQQPKGIVGSPSADSPIKNYCNFFMYMLRIKHNQFCLDLSSLLL